MLQIHNSELNNHKQKVRDLAHQADQELVLVTNNSSSKSWFTQSAFDSGINTDLQTLRLLADEREKIEEKIAKNGRLIDLLTEITSNPEQLRDLLISIPRDSENIEDLEMEMEQLLDIYLHQLQDINSTLKRLVSSIQASKETIELKEI